MQQRTQWRIPLVTIRRDGALALSPAAYEALRPAQHVALAYESATSTLTITPASPDTPRCLSLARDGTAALIRARRFWRRSGIAEERHHGRRYPAEAVLANVAGDADVARCLVVHLAAAS